MRHSAFKRQWLKGNEIKPNKGKEACFQSPKNHANFNDRLIRIVWLWKYDV